MFNPFKKKPQTPKPAATSNAQEPYLGDLNKTGILYQLCIVPNELRDENWKNKFLANIGGASFRAVSPQTMKGPDGFLYFQLFLPEPGKGFQCFVIDKLMEFTLEQGIGIVINPDKSPPDWVLTYGDILNYKLNKKFYSTDDTFSKKRANETLVANEKVAVGAPSENLLPKSCREKLKKHFIANRIEDPKVLLMMRHVATEVGVEKDLVFNVNPKDLETDEIFNNVMRSVAWFLPRHYSYTAMDEKKMEGFLPL